MNIFRVLLGFLNFVSGSPKWWETGTIYQVYPRSFKDSNNDGIGDIKGITEKLGYLAELGVSGVWLSPIYTSPMVDFGYDISNYTDINPEYGTLEDFDELVVNAKALGLRIIMDFVPNHSSDQHEWFIKSANREAPYEDFYIWRDPVDGGPPNNWLSLFYGPAWTFHPDRQQYYLHQFASAQPDLNYRNPAVRQAMKDVITFWMNRGVEGFRIDAVPFLFESPDEQDEPKANNNITDPDDYDYLEHIYTRDYQETYDTIAEWRELIDDQNAVDGVERFLMVEAYATIPLTMKYFGTEDQPMANFPFNFQFIPVTNKTRSRGFKKLINEWVDALPENGHSNWLVGNHDNHRIGSRVGKDLIDGMNILILMLPGTAVTYYGEEIGMVDNLDITYEQGQDPEGCNYPADQFYEKSRDFERTPFQWDDSVNAGFNDGAKTWLPVSSDYKTLNLEAQKNDPNSHYNIYLKMQELRRHPILQGGRLQVQVAGNDTLAVLRALDSSDFVIGLINFSEDEETVDLDEVFLVGPDRKLLVYASSGSPLSGSQVYAGSVTLSAKSSAIFTLPDIQIPPIDVKKTSL